jgi:thiamine phosphate synthase YjbQ (UPF0047 family)
LDSRWTIGTEDEENLLSGRAVCPGGPEDQSSYRSELTGLYAILAITHQLCKYYNVEEGYIEIGCNGQSALQTALEHEPFLSKDLPDYDLIGAIYSLRKSSRISWSFKHVKGHQDDHSTELDTWAQRNIQMDIGAKAHLWEAKHIDRHFDTPGEPWQLWVKGRKVTRNIQSMINEAIQSKSSEEYWGAKREVQ